MNIQRRVHPSDEQEQSMAAQIVHVITVGDIPFLLDHLRDDHKVDMHDGFTFNHRYVKSNPLEVENATWMLTVFNCFGKYFCLHFGASQLCTACIYSFSAFHER
jgi:hypothetical protein